MAPTSDVLREWISPSTPQNNDPKATDVIDPPVVATLVETIPRIYKQGNVLFKSAYGQVGQHINQSFQGVGGAPDRAFRSSNSSFEVEMIHDDAADTGELRYINGELVQVISIEEDDDDDMYEQAFHNRTGPTSRIRNFFSRRRGKDKKESRHNSSKSKGLRGRRGSRDKKFREQRSERNSSSNNKNNNTGRFPIPSNANDNAYEFQAGLQIPFAPPCMKKDLNQTRRGLTRPSAPAKQKMSRAAANIMEEVDITNDYGDVSDLGTDILRDHLSLSHACDDSEIDKSSSFDETMMRRPLSKDNQESSNGLNNVSWMTLVEKAMSILEAGTIESEVENDTDTEVLMNIDAGSVKPNISTQRKKVTYDKSIKREYETRLKNVHQLLDTQALTPPRKSRPRSLELSEGRVPTPPISTPPRHAFRHISSESPIVQQVAVKRRRSKDTFNNALKVVFVGSPNSGKTSLINALVRNDKKPKKSKKCIDVNIETWSPAPINGDRQIKFHLWDLPGGNIESGAHHSTQSLFFSSNSLYVIAWDISLKSATIGDQLPSDESYESDYDSDYEEAIMNEKRDQIIERDIDEQVMYWIDILSKHGLSNSAILPVATFTDAIGQDEVDRRCGILMQRLLKIEFEKRQDSNVPQLVFDAEGNIPRLSSAPGNSIVALQSCLLDIANSRHDQSAFKHHFESKLCAVTVCVQEILNNFKEIGSKIVPSAELLVALTENPPDVENFSQHLVQDALNFLTSIGTIMYYGSMNTICTRPHYLQDYIILNPRWLSTALSLTLRLDPGSALSKTRQNTKGRIIGMEKINQSLPILSSSETVEIWGHTDYVRMEAKRMESKDGPTNLYTFLQQLCEHCGIFIPFAVSAEKKKKSKMHRNKETFYLLPMLANQVPAEIWSYKVKDSWKTTLCNSYIFPYKVPCSFMDKIAVSVVKDLIELPVSDSSLKIQQIMYWKTAMYIKVSEEVSDEAGRKYFHISEILLHLIENDSQYSVNSRYQSHSGRKLIVSAKGPEGGWGEKIWKLGYESVLYSIDNMINIFFARDSVKREIVCPYCLLHAKPSEATVWDRDEISHEDECILCPNGHETHPRLVLGHFEDDDCTSVATGATSVYSAYSAYSSYTNTSTRSFVKTDLILPAIVIVALWDREENEIIRIGSGFIADNKKGLIVTASHILYNFDNDEKFQGVTIDMKFFGKKNATAIIGTHHGNDSVVFTYCADVIASDVYNVDGCILQIKTKFERPVELDRNHLTKRSEYPIMSRVKQERLQRLVMTTQVQRDQEVRVIGFRQTGEGILQAGSRINRTACMNRGYISRPIDKFDNGIIESIMENGEKKKFIPRSEIVAICATGGGNSGGPFVSESGEVIGILSRADPVQTERCYLTPAIELKKLLQRARNECRNGAYPPPLEAMEQVEDF